MANERLRSALRHAGLTNADAAEKIGVDAKTVERWTTTNRTPFPRHRQALSTLLSLDESHLWPTAVPPQRQARIAASEIVGVYRHRSAVPAELWEQLLDGATDRIDVLVHSGLFLVERHDLPRVLGEKAAAGVRIRIIFGDPANGAVALRTDEEGLSRGVLAARIRFGLFAYKPLVGTPGVEFRFHRTTLYNSIFRFDGEMIVNSHIYGLSGARAPALHLRKLGADDLFDTFVKSFGDVWALSQPARW